MNPLPDWLTMLLQSLPPPQKMAAIQLLQQGAQPQGAPPQSPGQPPGPPTMNPQGGPPPQGGGPANINLAQLLGGK